MVELRVAVLCRVVVDADGGPREVLQVVRKLNEKNAVVAINEADLLFESVRPDG